MSVEVEQRAIDGSVIVWDGDEAIMLTPAGSGVIVTVGRRGMHPFDTRPTLLSLEGGRALRRALARLEAER